MYIASNGIKTAVILRDPDPYSPREDDNLGTMICWHRRYNLGDDHNFEDSQELAERLAINHLDIKDLFHVIRDGHLENHRMERVDQARINGTEIGPHLELQIYAGLPDHKKWQGTGWRCDMDLNFITAGGDCFEDLVETFNTKSLFTLLDKSDKLAILPLYLYDHSGLSISTGSFIGRAPHASWDSGQVGYIWLDKKTAMESLAIPGDKVRPAKLFENDSLLHMKSDHSVTLEGVMRDNGYSPVQREDIVEPDQYPSLCHLADAGCLFKNNHNRLYAMEEQHPDGSFDIRTVASFNPDLKRLTDENWKSRALDILECEVAEYDNYLRGDVYGYELYEGTVLEESVWGFNPGSEEIQDLMKAELGSWFGPDMEFTYSNDASFDIEDFYESHDFPALRDKLRSEVESMIEFHGEWSPLPYPFGITKEDLLANKEGVLDNIVKGLYDEHVEHDSNAIYEGIIQHAGESRELKPKITIHDLEPNRDYTAEELLGILKTKPTLADMILRAQSRQAGDDDHRNVHSQHHER